MPNNEWWLADYLNYEDPTITTTVVNGLRYYTAWPACPASWTVWDVAKAKSLITTYGSTNLSRVKAADTWATSYAGDDYYGLHILPTCLMHETNGTYDCRSNGISQVNIASNGTYGNWSAGINGNEWSDVWDPYHGWDKCGRVPCSPVRCYRSL